MIVKRFEKDQAAETLQQSWLRALKNKTRKRFIAQHEKNIASEIKAG